MTIESTRPRVLALAGSTRRESLNKRLLATAVTATVRAGAEVTPVDLAEMPMPLYDGDLERAEGLPPAAVRLKELIRDHDAMLLAAPEYNGSITAVLKNAIDWASRTPAGEKMVFRGKTAALLSASPGGLGGMRGLVHLRAILTNLGVVVLPRQLSISSAAAAFDERGQLSDGGKRDALDALAEGLVDLTRRLAAP